MNKLLTAAGITIFIVCSCIGVTFATSTALAQDAAAGEKVFTRCQGCHALDESKREREGPALHGVIGRTAGAVPNFKYSEAMIAAGKSGMVWDEPTLTAFLHDPKGTVKGTTMRFAGIKADENVANVIAYLKQFPE